MEVRIRKQPPTGISLVQLISIVLLVQQQCAVSVDDCLLRFVGTYTISDGSPHCKVPNEKFTLEENRTRGAELCTETGLLNFLTYLNFHKLSQTQVLPNKVSQKNTFLSFKRNFFILCKNLKQPEKCQQFCSSFDRHEILQRIHTLTISVVDQNLSETDCILSDCLQ